MNPVVKLIVDECVERNHPANLVAVPWEVWLAVEAKTLDVCRCGNLKTVASRSQRRGPLVGKREATYTTYHPLCRTCLKALPLHLRISLKESLIVNYATAYRRACAWLDWGALLIVPAWAESIGYATDGKRKAAKSHRSTREK